MDTDIDHKALFDAAPVPHFILKATGSGMFVLAEANRHALAYFKKPPGDLCGKRLDEILHRDEAAIFSASIEKILADGKPVAVQTSEVLPGGLRLSGFWINPITDASGTIIMLDVMAMPAGADQASVQRERDDAISLLTSVFDVSEVGIVVTDQHQRIVRVNESFVRIYGWKRDELIGNEIVNLIAHDEREMARKNHDEFIKTGIRSSGEMKILRKDGKIANALYTTAALELSHGRRFQVTTIMDITLRKQMENTLRLAKEQADTANQAKSTFLANMSHELRTPLNAIIGFSEMMQKGTFGPLGHPKYTEYMGDVHSSAVHLLEIINEVLDMSKIEAGRVELDEEYFDIRHMVDSVTRMMASRAFSSGLQIRPVIADGLPRLYADPRLIRQILINLVGNAVKYSKVEGTIEVRAHLSKSGGMQLVVADNGVGIPKDKIKEALEPFGQVSHRDGAGQGTGLGLPLAKAMAGLHDGTLALESDSGKGTIVTVELPAFRLEKPQDDRPADGKSPLSGLKAPSKKAGVAHGAE